MKRTRFSLGLLPLLATLGLAWVSAPAAHAAPYVYVGSYQVGDGPLWFTNPQVYSAREAAALLFGGLDTDYAISTDPDTDTVNHLAWVDGWADTQYLFTPISEDFKKGNFYNENPGVGNTYSAYVGDHTDNSVYKIGVTRTNYVFRPESPNLAPEPASLALLAMGGLPLLRRRRRHPQD
jgi:MYXO-CTERM domain-containing protein